MVGGEGERDRDRERLNSSPKSGPQLGEEDQAVSG